MQACFGGSLARKSFAERRERRASLVDLLQQIFILLKFGNRGPRHVFMDSTAVSRSLASPPFSLFAFGPRRSRAESRSPSSLRKCCLATGSGRIARRLAQILGIRIRLRLTFPTMASITLGVNSFLLTPKSSRAQVMPAPVSSSPLKRSDNSKISTSLSKSRRNAERKKAPEEREHGDAAGGTRDECGHETSQQRSRRSTNIVPAAPCERRGAGSTAPGEWLPIPCTTGSKPEGPRPGIPTSGSKGLGLREPGPAKLDAPLNMQQRLDVLVLKRV
jgi:hypothetical protein